MRSHSLLALSMLTIAATAAQAADLPSRRAPPVYVPPPIPVFTWTGFFAGANAGAAFNDSNRSTSTFFPTGSIPGTPGTSGTLTLNRQNGNKVGFTGGGQIGYNYELGGAGLGGLGGLGGGLGGLGGLGGFGGGGLVIGVIADAQYLDRNNGASTGTFNALPPFGQGFVPVPGLPRTRIVTNQRGLDNFFGTVRGRLGVAFDRALLFGSGGLAYNTHTTGYTYGGGIEYSLTNNISIGAEYLRVHLSQGFNETAVYTSSGNLTRPGVLTVNASGGRDEFNVARAFLNYRFTYAAVPPVVARY